MRLRFKLSPFFFAIALSGLLNSPASTMVYNSPDLAFLSDNHKIIQLASGWEWKPIDSEQWQKTDLPVFISDNNVILLRKAFTIDSSQQGDFYQLYFEAIKGSCTIFLNEKIIGSHKGAFPFILDVNKDLFSDQRNMLLVEIHPRLDYKSTIPLALRNRGLPPVGGGIIGNVTLYVHAAQSVYSLDITSQRSEKELAHILFAPKFAGIANFSYMLYAEIADSEGQPVWRKSSPYDGTNKLEASIDNPAFWSTGQGRFYTLKLTFAERNNAVEELACKFAIDPDELAEKRSENFIKGVTWHFDQLLLEMSQEKLRKQIHDDVLRIVNLGANTIYMRSCFPPEPLVNACDSLGLNLWVELPLINAPGKILSGAPFREKAVELFKEVIYAFENHPSVSAWSLGNGFDVKDEQTLEFFQQMIKEIKPITRRPIFASLQSMPQREMQLPLDFIVVEVFQENLQNFSAENIPVSHKTVFQLASHVQDKEYGQQEAEVRQAYQIRRALQQIDPGQALGIIICPYRDWKGDMPHTAWGARENANLYLAGLVDYNNRQRPVFDIVKAKYHNKILPELFIKNAAADERLFFLISGLIALFIFLYFFKSDRRLRAHLRRVFIFPHGFFMDLSQNRRVPSFLTWLVGVVALYTISAIISSLSYHLQPDSYFDEILSWLFADPVVKYRAIWLIDHPIIMLVFWIFVLMAIFLVFSIFLKIAIVMQNRLIRFSQLLAFNFWAGANLVFLLPLAIVLYRLLARSQFVLVSFLFLALMLLWFFARIFRGTRVMLATSHFKTVIFFIFFPGIPLLGAAFWLNMQKSLLSYAEYYYHLFF